MSSDTPKLYAELASWWPLFSSPADYLEEAEFFQQVLLDSCHPAPATLLELGSGGGNNASHLKTRFQLTLVDRSPQMLDVSRKLNPECEHIEGDMRSVRLNRLFDAVFIHDAICYMTTEQDLRSAIETAFVHCRPRGVALFVPDYTRETFKTSTEHGGDDDRTRGIRYLEWSFDPDPSDTTHTVCFVYLLRDEDGLIRVEHEQHLNGLFSENFWNQLLKEVGFTTSVIDDQYGRRLFIGRKPENV